MNKEFSLDNYKESLSSYSKSTSISGQYYWIFIKKISKSGSPQWVCCGYEAAEHVAESRAYTDAAGRDFKVFPSASHDKSRVVAEFKGFLLSSEHDIESATQRIRSRLD